MKKHIFKYLGKQPMPDLAPCWVGYKCVFCDEISGLDSWQIADMPPSMAKCTKSPVHTGFFERLFHSINCLRR